MPTHTGKKTAQKTTSKGKTSSNKSLTKRKHANDVEKRDSNSTNSSDSGDSDNDQSKDRAPPPSKKQKKAAVSSESEEEIEMEEGTNNVHITQITLPVKLISLHKKHKSDIPDGINVKANAQDIPLLFSDLCDMNFHKNGETTKARGRWCLTCNLYAERCAERGIAEHPRAVPPRIAKAREAEALKAEKESGTQSLQKHGFNTLPATQGPKEFRRLRFWSTHQSISSARTRQSLLSEYPCRVKEMQTVIGLVATCGDMWSSPSNKMPFFGAMSSYILIIPRKKKRPLWKLKSTILGFRSVEGAHDGDNLGRYYLGMC
ncbi:hypothetical protein BDP27DRAFT_1370813 [Rhodocollybia butyracea]|uniref:Uncharacterized protein n=1 Tax=Rhodocollybia butyracea TaxID=206335 RepID=A0A9P5PDJ1_9AGAR|nr:hypothetical protein BDP27DRAFT_1370813 [Rhodocollybia butyracea]